MSVCLSASLSVCHRVGRSARTFSKGWRQKSFRVRARLPNLTKNPETGAPTSVHIFHRIHKVRCHGKRLEDPWQYCNTFITALLKKYFHPECCFCELCSPVGRTTPKPGFENATVAGRKFLIFHWTPWLKSVSPRGVELKSLPTVVCLCRHSFLDLDRFAVRFFQ